MKPPDSDGIWLIRNERLRQVNEEGFSAEHDDCHAEGQLAHAAACYADAPGLGSAEGEPPTTWPWADDWWKPCPNDRIRELAKAGALIAAEIDRLLRLQTGDQNDRHSHNDKTGEG